MFSDSSESSITLDGLRYGRGHSVGMSGRARKIGSDSGSDSPVKEHVERSRSEARRLLDDRGADESENRLAKWHRFSSWGIPLPIDSMYASVICDVLNALNCTVTLDDVIAMNERPTICLAGCKYGRVSVYVTMMCPVISSTVISGLNHESALKAHKESGTFIVKSRGSGSAGCCRIDMSGGGRY